MSFKNTVLKHLDDMKASEINTLDVRGQASFTDYIIVATGSSHRHVRAIAENLSRELKKETPFSFSIAGAKEGSWVALDLFDVVVHIMLAETRAFFGIEKLWFRPSTACQSLP